MTRATIAVLAALLIASPAIAETRATVGFGASVKVENGVTTTKKTANTTIVRTPSPPQHERSVMRSVEVRPGGMVRIRTLTLDNILGNSYTIETRRPAKASANGSAKGKR